MPTSERVPPPDDAPPLAAPSHAASPDAAPSNAAPPDDASSNAAPPADALHDAAITWFRRHRRPLPWREPGTTAWGVLVSEVMSQQTPVSRVSPQWTAWMQRWPTPESLADAPTAEVLKQWGTLGYPRRALRLQQAAAAVRDRHAGRVPHDVDELLSLPGIGTYTAAAVATFAYGGRHPVVDVNVRRVLARAADGLADPAPSPTAHELRLARALLPQTEQRSAEWSVAVMELGALVCVARTPRCASCPLLELCAWQRAGCPPSSRPARRRQVFEGTDRQVRGRIMAVLRECENPVATSTFETASDDPAQRERALASLLADGLVQQLDDGTYCLPGAR